MNSWNLSSPVKKRELLLVLQQGLKVPVKLSIFIWFLIGPAIAETNKPHPFSNRKTETISFGTHECRHLKARQLITAVKPIKPSSCKISSTLAGDKVVYSCSHQDHLNLLSSMLSQLDSYCRSIKVKVHWVILQADCAKDLLQIFCRKDVNLKSLWKLLIQNFSKKGLAKTMASPEVTTIVGSDFQIQSQEFFKQNMWLLGEGKNVIKVQCSQIQLSVKGTVSELEGERYLVNLELKHHTDTDRQDSQPGSLQTLKTDILLSKGELQPAGGLYQFRTYAQKQGNILFHLIPYLPDHLMNNEQTQEYVSTVFIEII